MYPVIHYFNSIIFPIPIMKLFHLRSYIIGVITGVVIIIIFVSAKSFLKPESEYDFSSNSNFDRQERGEFQREGMQGRIMNEDSLQGMAERIGITIEELQVELDAGKTLPEIAEERGMEFQRGIRGEMPIVPVEGTGATNQSGTLMDTEQEESSDTGSTF